MVRLLTITFLMLGTLLSCTKDDVAVTTLPIPAPAGTDTAQSRTYLALGDSYTIGQSVPATDRYPVQTVKYLSEQRIKFESPEIIAQTGWTTANLLSAIASSPPLKSQYDMVTLLIGVNNQYQFGTQQEYADQFLTLLNLAIKYAGNNKQRVIVLSIPDYSVTPFANGRDKKYIATQIDSFNLINKAITARAGVGYLDVTGFSRLAANNPSLIASDGLHFSGEEYKVWAEALVSMIKRVLQ
jgi:lysophospholipase L1-like esterase